MKPEHNERILSIISELCTTRPDQIGPQDRLREDLGMDSVSTLELVSMLAEEFEIDVDIEEAIEVTDVGGVFSMAARYLEKKS